MKGGAAKLEAARAFRSSVARWSLSLLAAVGACCCASAIATNSRASATPVWLGPRQVSPPGLASEGDVAIDDSGDVAVVWSGPGNSIDAAVRPGGDMWQAPVVISQGVGEVKAPLIATSATGKQAAIIWGRERTVDVSEGSLDPFHLFAPTMLSPEAQGAGEPDLAMDGTGDSVSGWYGYENREKSAELDFRPTASAPWLGPSTVSEKSPSDYGAAPVQVAIGAGGDAVAAWSRFTRTVRLRNEVSYRPAGGAWQPPATLPGPGTFSPIQLGVDARGDAVAVWQSTASTGAPALEASVRPATSGSWQSPKLIAESEPERRSAPVPRVGPNPALAVGEDGEAVLAWETVRGGRRVVEVATGSASTGAWQPAVSLASWPDWPSTSFVDDPPMIYPGPTPIARPSVALAADGEALVAWDDASSRFAGTVQVAVRRVPGAGWERPVAVASVAAEGVRIAVDALGEAAVVWDRLAESGDGRIESDILARLGITGASLSHRRFRLHRRASRISAPFGARLRFDLSGPAHVTISVTAYRSGVPRGGRCVSALPRRPAKPLAKCTRRISLGGWREDEAAGSNTIALTRKLASAGLNPGTYRLVVSAASSGETASPVSLPFYVAR